MELSGIKFALILFLPIAVWFVLMLFFILLLSPFIRKVFVKPREIEKEMKEALQTERALIEEKMQKGEVSSCNDIATSLERQRSIIKDGIRRMRKAYNEESGYAALKKEMNKDIRDIFK
jgi:flagellar biosynthesis/type III secretory pathway M-ring protein FliF/YscJ